MSIKINCNNLGSRVNFCLDETSSKSYSDDEDLEVFVDEKKSTRHSNDTECMIVFDSTSSSLDSPSKVIVENTDFRGSDIIGGCKRPRDSSSSTDSPGPRSRSASPEISWGGTPVTYKLQEVKGEFLIVKIPMNKSRARNKKCSDRDIAHLLDSDSDSELIFDNLKKSGAQIVGTLPRETKSPESPETAKRTPKRLQRTTRSSSKETCLDNTPSKNKSSKEEEVSLRIKLRRSTEQSNYKIQTIFEDDENKKCRSSPRSKIGTPKRCGVGDCDEDHSVYKKTRGTPKTPRRTELSRVNEARTRTPRRTRRSSSTIMETCDGAEENNCQENGNNRSEKDIDDENDIVISRRRSTARTSAKVDPGTPQNRIKKVDEISTPRSARTRRNTRLVSHGENMVEDFYDKENKSDNEDSDTVDTRVRERRKSCQPIVGTPKKQAKILEEASTPKRTPRKSVIRKLEESTPKKTPRRSAIKKIDEPITPTTNGKRISRINTPSMKNGALTPSMSRRTGNVGKPITILEEARARLHVSAVPKSLPCREEEFNDIYQFLERKLLDNNGGCIYISGVPGTGKTATVNEVIRCLKKLVAKGDLENFDFIEINGMKLSEPRQAYVQILKQINGQTATWEQAYQILEKRFTLSSAKRPMTLLLVDELDLLCNKRQDVVYNLLDWPAKANAHLVVITIANTMDLPERVLMGRVTSRLGLTRLTFQPYNHKQLQEIVMARLKDSDAFKSEAIQLVARKVAAVSGDARRALDICRRATEIAELNDGKIVTMQDVNQALTEMIASAKVQAIKHCSQMEKIFLQAVCAEVARTGVEETSFYNVYRQFESLCSFEGLKIPNITQTLGICGRLGANRLLLCEHSRTDTQQRILLNVSSDDIHFAMQTINVA